MEIEVDLETLYDKVKALPKGSITEKMLLSLYKNKTHKSGDDSLLAKSAGRVVEPRDVIHHIKNNRYLVDIYTIPKTPSFYADMSVNQRVDIIRK